MRNGTDMRVEFIGGPADGQYRHFPNPPATVNWMTATGPFVYVLDADAAEYHPEGD
jgi:hypothetical protein